MAKIKGRCKILANGCWQFQGFRNRQGYGFTSYRGKPWSVHRLVLMIAKGPIPKKLKACHSCDYPPCANPDHVFAGTSSQNTRDSVAKKRHAGTHKTECKRGHKFTKANTYIEKPTGRRHCKACDRAKQRIQAGWPEALAYSEPALQGHYPEGLKRVPFVKKGYPVRTSCKNGHPMTLQADVYLTPEGYRRCRRCRTAAVGRFVKRLIQSETGAEHGE